LTRAEHRPESHCRSDGRSTPMNTSEPAKGLDELAAHNGQSAAGDGGKRELQRAPASHRVYVGNLPWSTSWQDLKDHFRQAGEPLYTTVFTDESGRSKGCGIVEFGTKEEAQKAIQTLNDSTIGDTGRMIFVREDREERPPPIARPDFRPRRAGGNLAAAAPSSNASSPPPRESAKGRQVFVGNLPYQMSWQDLKDAFRPAGNVIRADVLLLSNGKSKGQGTVLFETKAEAVKAIELFDNTEIQGRVINVHEDKFAQ